MSRAEVLIISSVADTATDAVIQHLSANNAGVWRLNTEDLPFERSLTLGYEHPAGASFVFDGRPITPTSIWYRRVRAPAKPAAMDSGIYDFCLRENRAALIGGLLTQRTRWMNHPAAVWRAEFKPYQLQVARDAGLRIPKTLVSNDPQAIRNAYDQFGALVVKPTRSGHFWQEGQEFSVFTSVVTEADLQSLDDAKWAPSIYQELIPKRFDIRVTCIGSQFLAAAIHSQTDPAASIDWRKTDDPTLPHSVIELPGALVEKLAQLMRRLDLEFGCIDLVLTPDDDYVFLEVNPSGQWLWLDDQLDLGISRAVANWLCQ